MMRSMQILGFAAILMILPAITLASPIDEFAQEGDEAFRNGDYAQAIDLYMRVLENGYESAALYYNLGNAHFKNSELGSAILWYERAQQRAPHDPDIRYNLTLAKSRTVDRIEEAPRLGIWDLLDKMRDLIDPSFGAGLAWSFALLASLFLAIGLLVKYELVQKGAFVSSGVMAFFFVISISLVMLRVAEENGPPGAVVMVDKVVVRSAPDGSAGEVFHLHEGTRVEIVKHLEGYYEIRLADGRQGWLPSEVCVKV